MRALVLLGVIVAGLSGVQGCASTTPTGTPTWHPLSGADCLDPASTRSWHEVSSSELLVDAGRRKYRLTLAHQCSLLGATIGFAGDPISGRVCGNPGDAIVVDRGERCRIDRIERIDGDTWNRARNPPRTEVSGAVSR